MLFLVQLKCTLSAITTDVETLAIGDILYRIHNAIYMDFQYQKFALFTLFIIAGGIMMTAITVILSSLSFG